ncbi:MAG: zinc ribbon domain-containing protein [Anaerolineales bacterium]|jgi:rubrerythrin
MDLGSLFLILALLLLVILFISRPFIERRRSVPDFMASSEEHELSSLMAERDRLLNALQELDFDHALGKIPDEDYPHQRSILLHKGAEILREIDQFQAEATAEDAEARLEAAIAARRADAADTLSPAARAEWTRAAVSAEIANPDDELEVLLAKRRRERQEKSAGFCPQCGGPVQKSDRFCPKCGTILA